MFQNELKNVEKRRNKLKQIVKKDFFSGRKNTNFVAEYRAI